jgi:alpha-mannosidase
MTYDQALKFVDEFPFFNYAQSQMQTYAWVESLFPEMMQRIDAAVEAGRWIPVGGMWVEPDCNLPSGESFVRQLLYGKGWIRDRYGIDIRVGWNPDSFGYSRTLPMIFKGAGIDYFITQKIGWNDTTEFPHRLFWWEAPDGSRVLSYFPFTYVDDARPEVLAERLIDQQDQQPGLEDMLNLYGVGDHGGGPTREMIQRYIAMSTLKTFPTVEHATPISFMERVEDKYQGRIPVWKDELYLEYHRGTFTTQAEIKRRNRRMESALESAEKFATVAEALVEDYRYPDEWLDGAWLRTLFNQFHDSGSGHDERAQGRARGGLQSSVLEPFRSRLGTAETAAFRRRVVRGHRFDRDRGAGPAVGGRLALSGARRARNRLPNILGPQVFGPHR